MKVLLLPLRMVPSSKLFPTGEPLQFGNAPRVLYLTLLLINGIGSILMESIMKNG